MQPEWKAERLLSIRTNDTIQYSARRIPHMKRPAWFFAVLIAMLCSAASSHAQTTKGAVIFENRCASCHGNPSATTPAPDVLSLWKMTSEGIYAALGKAPHTSMTGVAD